MAQRNRVVVWNDVKDIAEHAFHVWTGQPELGWAESAWTLLGRAGLATYQKELDRCRVIVRLLSLAGLYRDFCDLAWDERHQAEYEYWLSETDLPRFRVGQLIGPRCEFSDVDDDALYATGLKALADEARAEVARALLTGIGSPALLFVSLWVSRD